MRLDLSRAHMRVLGLTGEYKPLMPEELLSIGRVEVTLPVKAFLRAQLETSGQYRGGPLFGYRLNGVIVALRAATNGYTGWHGPEHGPLDPDERYLLGWIDCLRGQDDAPLPIDWVGNWLIYPNGQLPEHFDDDLEWITRASQTRLIDKRNCLLIVGEEEEKLAAHAYTGQSSDGKVVVLYHNLAGTQPSVLHP